MWGIIEKEHREQATVIKLQTESLMVLRCDYEDTLIYMLFL